VSDSDSADKTEKPTPKKLREARKRGDVPKSKDLSSTVALFIWLVLSGALMSTYQEQFSALMDQTFDAFDQRGTAAEVVTPVALEAARLLVMLGVLPALLVGMLGTLVEFLQVRGVFTFEKIKPDLKHLNPIDGIKRIFSLENLVELVKSVLKTLLVLALVVIILRMYANDLHWLAHGTPQQAAGLWWRLSFALMAWSLVFFLLLSFLDMGFQVFNHIKKLRMSRRDIKQELREDEGDPYIKGRRRQLHQEWAQQNMAAGVRRASVVVTNPTHYAVAIYYEKGETVVPVVTAKGEDDMARLIRETAAAEGIPVMRQVELARSLYAEVELDDYVPRDLFEAVAQVLAWAREVRDASERGEAGPPPPGSSTE
jgi:type III secretion protein U